MYAAFDDPYCYPGTSVLRNIPGLRNNDELARFEAISSAQRALDSLPSGTATATHYRAIHRHLFRDVYAWAGRYRTVRIAKGGSMFCYPEHIADQMRQLFAKRWPARLAATATTAEFADQAAVLLSELNAIHPFRDGNGRTQMAFLALLADRAGHGLDLAHIRPKAFVTATIASVAGDLGPLATEIERLLAPGPARLA